MSQLHERARAARKQRQWTQQQAATQVGMSLRAYQNFEGGESTPQPANLRAIVETFELDDDETGAETRDSWPVEVQVFLDVMGAYLMAYPEQQRLKIIHGLTRQIFSRSDMTVR